ncbi:MAG TPA: aminotransferase class IV, partial [Gemmatimonadales bacterium]|nr:aminotransferase class IV [Gemmatimonadales bacterium]
MSSVLARTLFETVRVRDGVAPLWPLHLERLRRSAQALDIPLPDITRPEGGEDRVLRFECHDGGLYVTEREVGGTAPLAVTWYGMAVSPERNTALPVTLMQVNAVVLLPEANRSPMRPPQPLTAPSAADACQMDCWSLCENSLGGSGTERAWYCARV